MITRDEVLKRLAALKAKRDELSSNVNAYNGAIEDCEFWLAKLPERAELRAVPAEPEEVEATAT
jgi:uncharacterized coiled-coil DUF342 family protein